MMRWLAAALAVVALLAAVRLAPGFLARLALAAERAASRLRLRHAVVDGFSIPYLEGGRGEPLVLLHGFGGDKDNFTRLARHLTPHFRVLVPDLPGFGDAGRRHDASYAMADQARRLRDFLDGLGIVRAHLGGNSMGGFIAAQFAGMWPGRVASVWLIDAAGTAAAYETGMVRHYRETGEMPLLVRREADFGAVLDATMSRPPFMPGFLRRHYGQRGAADHALHTSILRQLHASPLLESQFASIDVPALVVWGAEDEVLHPAGAQALRELFPQARVRVMDGIGHLPMLEAPRQCARDYIAFRRELAEA